MDNESMQRYDVQVADMALSKTEEQIMARKAQIDLVKGVKPVEQEKEDA